jgi:hypothetical protein
MDEPRLRCDAICGLAAHLGLPEGPQGDGARAVTAALAGVQPRPGRVLLFGCGRGGMGGPIPTLICWW